MYMCVCLCVSSCVRACLSVCVCVRTYACLCVCVCIHVSCLQVSHVATCSCLGDRNQFPSFFRTIPSDDFQVNCYP